ncbi:MAG: SAM-dependent methyltransferase [Flavobacteriales bacterium]
MFETKDTAEYYNTTQVHYEQWWNLGDTLSLHYGIWDKDTKSFADSLKNTNRVLMENARIEDGDRVLDAGCGVGGAIFFMLSQKKIQATGITLSEKQIRYARSKALEFKVEQQARFEQMSYTQTTFPDESFDVIWACESICHCTAKEDFMKEAYRLLKKGGRLILCDYFLVDEEQKDPKRYIQTWLDTWTITKIVTSERFVQGLESNGFKNVKVQDYTSQIQKSARRMYLAGLAGALPSIIYNVLHPRASRFAKTHYKGALYQYRALKANLWRWKIVSAEK